LLEAQGGLLHARGAFVAEDQAFTARRWPAVVAAQHFGVGAADAYGKSGEGADHRVAARAYKQSCTHAA